MKKLVLVLIGFVAVSGFAQDRYFAHTYTSNVLAKGGVDVELWHTSRLGHQSGYFNRIDQRMEFEVGLGKRWQTAFYFNRYQTMESDSTGDINTKNEIGFSNEWKYQISKPTAKVGVAAYAELGVKGDELEWEGKLIIDRAFGKNLFAFNLTGEVEQEIERENGKYELEVEQTPVELAFAYMRFVKPDLGLGLEIRNNNQITHGKWQHSALFAGPTLNYRTDKWFAVVNYLPQITNLHKTAAAPHGRVLDEHEKSEIRLLVGFSF